MQHDHGRVDLAAFRSQQAGMTSLRPPAERDRTLPAATTKRAQVRGILEELIETELSPGEAIPSERALVVRLGVSR